MNTETKNESPADGAAYSIMCRFSSQILIKMKDIKAQLKWIYKLITDLQNSKIHYSQSTSWTRQNDEGYNDGIQLGISQLEKRAKYLERKLKSEVS